MHGICRMPRLSCEGLCEDSRETGKQLFSVDVSLETTPSHDEALASVLSRALPKSHVRGRGRGCLSVGKGVDFSPLAG